MLAQTISLSISLCHPRSTCIRPSLCRTRMGPRGTGDHLFRALSTFRKLLPASTVLSKVQPTRVVLDRFRQTVCISREFGNFPSNHVFQPADFEPLWVWTRPFVFLFFCPVKLSPSPPLKTSASQGLRTDFFVVHSGNMPCSPEHTFSNGSQHVHVALFTALASQFTGSANELHGMLSRM